MLTRGQDIAAARDRRPFRRRGLLVRTAIFPAASALAFALYPFGGPGYGLAFVRRPCLRSPSCRS